MPTRAGPASVRPGDRFQRPCATPDRPWRRLLVGSPLAFASSDSSHVRSVVESLEARPWGVEPCLFHQVRVSVGEVVRSEPVGRTVCHRSSSVSSARFV
jgi:hypothetical protein